MAGAVAADARGEVHPAAGFAGQADGVMHGAIGQPARVAPVQPLAPGLEELVEGGDEGTLLLAHSLGFVEVEAVLPAGWLVGEHDAWGHTGCSEGSTPTHPKVKLNHPRVQSRQQHRDALGKQPPATRCQRHLVAQGQRGSVLGIRAITHGDSTGAHEDGDA